MKKSPLFWFFILTYAITWGLAALYFIFPDFFSRLTGEMSLVNPVFILAVWGPNIAAVIVSKAIEGKGGIIKLLTRFIPTRTGIIWYLLVIFVIPVCGILINLLTNTTSAFLSMPSDEVLSLLLILLITGPLGEELGWRGFALPRLLKRYSATVASLILGIIWAFWHLPSFFTSGLPQAGMQIPLFIITALSLSIIATWIYIHTKGSVFLCFLLHYSVNFTATIIGLDLKYMAIFQVIIASTILVLYGWNLRKQYG